MVDTLAALVSNTESTPDGIPQNWREGSTPLTSPKYWREGSTPDGFRKYWREDCAILLPLLADAKIFLEPVQLWRVQRSGPNSSDG
jgi:hypothetical protein